MAPENRREIRVIEMSYTVLMVQTIRFSRTGGPEVLRLEKTELTPPGAGEVLIRQHAIGLNFIDTYHRSGLYPVELPSGLGVEGAGVIEAIGEGVENLQVGDRVAYAGGPLGADAEARVFPAERLVRLPESITEETAAAIMIKGMTAQYLLRRSYPIQGGETILIHAAAGGVGLLLCQWAKHLGATVIGTVGSQQKAELARAHGCEHTILYREEDWVARVREMTDGKGVPVVYDSVGAATFEGSLDCLHRLGMMVSYGNASGAVPPVAPRVLAQKGSLFLTRPTLFSYIVTREELESTASELFEMVASGTLEVRIGQRFALEEVAEAHRRLESRSTTGSTLLIP